MPEKAIVEKTAPAKGSPAKAAKAEQPTSREKLYEGMFLLDSGRFASDSKAATDQVIALIEKCGGQIVAHRPWQDGRLAYAIKGHRKGLHYLAYFNMPGDGIRDLNRLCKLSDLVLRHMVIEHPKVLFDAMVQALSGEWHPQDAPREETSERGRGRDRERERERDPVPDETEEDGEI